VVVITAVMGLLLYLAYTRLPLIPGNDDGPVELVRRLGDTTSTVSDWSVFQSLDGSDVSYGGATSRRFRLAGTFFAYVSDVAGAGDVRRAVIDDLRTGTQHVVSESEKIDDITVIKVFKDRVVIRDATGVDEQLWLTFSGYGASTKMAGTNDPADQAALKADKFGGKQLGENRWLFSREKLLEYYKELRDEPDRLVKVFDSFKPIYTDSGKISGYKIGIEGESEFFGSVGLSEGDVVRSVNSMQMSSRRHAEYMLSEFIADRANTFFFEIERENKPLKLKYDLR